MLELPSTAIAQLRFAALARAMRAAKYLPARGFHAVTNDFATTMSAFRSNYGNGALETIEDMGLAVLRDLECFVVVVSAQFAFSHQDYFASDQNSARLFPIQRQSRAQPQAPPLVSIRSF
jgi:hypothetical protein